MTITATMIIVAAAWVVLHTMYNIYIYRYIYYSY